MKKYALLLITMTVLVFCRCDNDQPEYYVKQVRLDLGVCGTVQHYCQFSEVYRNFNIHNYPRVKSVIFTVKLSSSSEISEASVALYNLTDSTIIENSVISTRSTDLVWYDSENLVNSFPDHDIDLTTVVTTEYQLYYAYTSAGAYLYISME